MGKTMNPELIRQFVDAELDAEQMASLEATLAQDPDFRARVEFERKLRNGVMRAMTNPDVATPESLRTQIQDIFQKETSAGLKLAATNPMDSDIQQDDDTIEFLNGPTRANFLAVAASLVIVAGAVLFGIFGPNLLDQPGSAITGDIQEVSTFVEDQHVSCVMDKEVLKKKAEFGPAEVGMKIQNYLGRIVTISDLSKLGYELIGGGRCGVPPSDFPSGHIIYRSSKGTMVGIFMQPNEGQFPQLRIGSTHVELNPEVCGGIIAWADENLVYFVTLCDSRDSATIVDAIRSQSARTP